MSETETDTVNDRHADILTETVGETVVKTLNDPNSENENTHANVIVSESESPINAHSQGRRLIALQSSETAAGAGFEG